MNEISQRARDQLSANGPAEAVVWAPYRVSPFGAHTDHQLGLTAGFTLDQGLALAWRGLKSPELRLSSEAFPGEARCTLGGDVPAAPGHWSEYVAGIAAGLASRCALTRGIEGRLCAEATGGGVSSSAALQVAVALALLEANGTRLDRESLVDVVVTAERERAGVAVGWLDPTVILHGREGCLVVLDPKKRKVGVHRFPSLFPPFELLLVHLGPARALRDAPYNERVEECREAARLLGSPSEPPVLRDVSPEEFRRRRAELPELPRRRAEHWFSEVKRVKRALQVLAASDLEGFASLMNASTDSLVTFFDCGTPETLELVRLLRADADCHGAGLAGGGFGGSVQAILKPGTGDSVKARLEAAWAAGGREGVPSATVARIGGGARVLRS